MRLLDQHFLKYNVNGGSGNTPHDISNESLRILDKYPADDTPPDNKMPPSARRWPKKDVDRITGKGQHTWQPSGAVLDYSFTMDYKEIITLSNGDLEIYEGEWKYRTSDFNKGRRQGKGVVKYISDGQSYGYVGEWYDDMMDGMGQLFTWSKSGDGTVIYIAKTNPIRWSNGCPVDDLCALNAITYQPGLSHGEPDTSGLVDTFCKKFTLPQGNTASDYYTLMCHGGYNIDGTKFKIPLGIRIVFLTHSGEFSMVGLVDPIISSDFFMTDSCCQKYTLRKICPAVLMSNPTINHINYDLFNIVTNQIHNCPFKKTFTHWIKNYGSQHDSTQLRLSNQYVVVPASRENLLGKGSVWMAGQEIHDISLDFGVDMKRTLGGVRCFQKLGIYQLPNRELQKFQLDKQTAFCQGQLRNNKYFRPQPDRAETGCQYNYDYGCLHVANPDSKDIRKTRHQQLFGDKPGPDYSFDGCSCSYDSSEGPSQYNYTCKCNPVETIVSRKIQSIEDKWITNESFKGAEMPFIVKSMNDRLREYGFTSQWINYLSYKIVTQITEIIKTTIPMITHEHVLDIFMTHGYNIVKNLNRSLNNHKSRTDKSRTDKSRTDYSTTIVSIITNNLGLDTDEKSLRLIIQLRDKITAWLNWFIQEDMRDFKRVKSKGRARDANIKLNRDYCEQVTPPIQTPIIKNPNLQAKMYSGEKFNLSDLIELLPTGTDSDPHVYFMRICRVVHSTPETSEVAREFQQSLRTMSDRNTPMELLVNLPDRYGGS